MTRRSGRAALGRAGRGMGGAAFAVKLRGSLGRVVVTAAAVGACVPAPQMCVSEPDCGGGGSCVAGRCLKHGAVAAITAVHRWLFPPVDVAVLSRGGDRSGAASESTLPAVAVLGRGDGATVFLRFAIALPPDASVLEAYLILPRADDVDADPDSIALHAARVTEAWDGATLRWARPPGVVEVGAPVTRVAPATSRPVRLDVRAIVERWLRRPEGEFGIAVVSEGRSATGVAFALAPGPRGRLRGDPAAMGSLGDGVAGGTPVERGARPSDNALSGPELELYAR